MGVGWYEGFQGEENEGTEMVAEVRGSGKMEEVIERV